VSARLFHIAWRNLWRNPRRTSITVAAIAVGYIMLLLFACLLEGLGQHMIDTGTRFLLSHVQVHAPDYYPDRSIHVTLGGQRGTEVRSLIDVLTADPRVRAAAPRVYGYGLVSSAYHSAGAELVGVVPTQEVQVTNLHACLVHGRYLTAQVPKGILLGETLAASIRATVGAELVLLIQAADGLLGNDLYTVVGVFRTGSAALDRGLVLMSLAAVLSIYPALKAARTDLPESLRVW
jgi:ABC-type lipoprotein release transport system permease subunit